MKINLYDIFEGDELKIAELIQQRRLQLLVHSYIYYEMSENIVEDRTWSNWALELADLQNKYPEIEKKVPFREGFENWSGVSGAFLPLHQEWIAEKAYRLLHRDQFIFFRRKKKTQKFFSGLPKRRPGSTSIS